MKHLFVLVFSGVLALPSVADACQGRTMVSGETVAQVAARCGVNEHALRQFNPGLSDRTIRPGLIVNVPPRPLPSPQSVYGRPRVGVQPPIAVGPNIQVQVPRHVPLAPKGVTIEPPLIGHMPSMLEPPR